MRVALDLHRKTIYLIYTCAVEYVRYAYEICYAIPGQWMRERGVATMI